MFTTFASPALAMNEEKLYSSVRGWDVFASAENGAFTGCGMMRPNQTFGMVLLNSSNNIWALGFRTNLPNGARVSIDMDLDRYSDVLQATSNGEFAGAQIQYSWVQALANGKKLWVEMENNRHMIPLRGTTAAILKVQECVGRYNAVGFAKGPVAVAPAAQPGTPPKPAIKQPVESDAARMGAGCPAYGSYRSPDAQDWGEVEFVNLTDAAVTIYWIDYNGHNVEMAGILPGEQVGFDSTGGHHWLAKDFSGTCHGGVLTLGVGKNLFNIR